MLMWLLDNVNPFQREVIEISDDEVESGLPLKAVKKEPQVSCIFASVVCCAPARFTVWILYNCVRHSRVLQAMPEWSLRVKWGVSRESTIFVNMHHFSRPLPRLPFPLPHPMWSNCSSDWRRRRTCIRYRKGGFLLYCCCTFGADLLW